eukprot:TRINITY_DN1431_c0_g1_i1.p1 TRINITY_DN1431_c0_g1~~TRINITY_DN1431_c0_g1_i1.p1  ORF type:complete len:198 (-),score=34.95 TRINITY_DN1431_c0_g1_i1:262-855(-)
MAGTSAGDWSDRALLVIDMQNDFLVEGACMKVEGGLAIVPAVQRTVEVARAKGAHVIWVVREHHVSGHDVEAIRKHLFQDGRPGGVVTGSVGAQLVEGLTAEAGDQVIVKKRWSAFFHTHLELILKRLRVTRIIIAGVQTPNCIRQTAFDAISYDYDEVVVLADATAAATPEVHQANLYDMRKIGILTPTVSEWETS